MLLAGTTTWEDRLGSLLENVEMNIVINVKEGTNNRSKVR